LRLSEPISLRRAYTGTYLMGENKTYIISITLDEAL
jgi:hypothetical protein